MVQASSLHKCLSTHWLSLQAGSLHHNPDSQEKRCDDLAHRPTEGP